MSSRDPAVRQGLEGDDVRVRSPEEAERMLHERPTMWLDREGIIVRVNDAWCEFYGTNAEYWIGTLARDHMDPEEHEHDVMPHNRGFDGKSQATFRYGPGEVQRLVLATWCFWAKRDAEGRMIDGGCIAQHESMDELARTRAQLVRERQARKTDPMTSIGNRAAVMAEGRMMLERLMEPAIVFFADIDEFKKINDTYGHSVGDLVIKAVASRLAGSVRSTDFVARWGGDEFLGILRNDDRRPLRAVMMRFRGLFASPVMIEGVGPVHVTMSFGCVRLTGAADMDVVQKQAESALKQSKLEGRNRFSFWSAEAQEIITGDLEPLSA